MATVGLMLPSSTVIDPLKVGLLLLVVLSLLGPERRDVRFGVQ